VRIVGSMDAAVGGEEDAWLLQHLVLDSMRDSGVGIEDVVDGLVMSKSSVTG